MEGEEQSSSSMVNTMIVLRSQRERSGKCGRKILGVRCYCASATPFVKEDGGSFSCSQWGEMQSMRKDKWKGLIEIIFAFNRLYS